MFLAFSTLKGFSQSSTDQGVTTFKVSYITQNKTVKAKWLKKRLVDREEVFWTNQYRKVVGFNKKDTLRITHRRYNEGFRYTRLNKTPYHVKLSLENDSINYIKLDTLAFANSFECDVYYYEDSSYFGRNKVFLKKGSPLKLGMVFNYRDVVKMIHVHENYTVVREVIKQDEIKDLYNSFYIDGDIIVIPLSKCLNNDSLMVAVEALRRCFRDKNKMPNYFILKNYEGSIRISFFIGKDGKPIHTSMSIIRLRNYFDLKEVKNPKQLSRIERIVKRKIIKDLNGCIGQQAFEVPLSDEGPVNAFFTTSYSYGYYSHD